MARSSGPPAVQGLLSLLPLPQEVKRAVVQGGEPTDVAQPAARKVLARWERSRRLGADPDGAHALEEAIVGDAEVRAARERIEPLWRSAHAIFEDFAGTCARHDFVTVLADADGIVVHGGGGGAFQREARRLRLIEGTSWTEGLRGTNAIGTALAEARPTAVHGAAHFARVNEGLVCIAAPIRDCTGEVVAVLDATSWAGRAPALDPSVVLTVARAIEEVLRARAYARSAGGIELVERLIESAAGAAFLLEAPGRLVRANVAARELLRRRTLDQMLPSWEQLAALADGGSVSASEWPGSSEAPEGLAVEPILREDGGLLAVLVVVPEPQPRRATAMAIRPPAHRAFGAILGDDPALAQARESCARLARSRLPILLLAETGAGKELFARAIHDASPRASEPFVAVNCGAIQPELRLSELFGHAPGAFTGAARGGREGIVAAADRGTLFLDEVADLSADAQVALLRFLEDGSYVRVGENRPRRADVRLVAATCRDLDAHVAAGLFRRDLYFRIGGACVELPPLRERHDFSTLLDALWARVRLPDGTHPPPLACATRACLAAHDWPGNVRELESVLDYAAIMAEGASQVDPQHLPAALQAAVAEGPTLAEPSGALDDARRRSLLAALRQSQGNVSAAARRLGVARSTVYRLARRYGLRLDGDAGA